MGMFKVYLLKKRAVFRALRRGDAPATHGFTGRPKAGSGAVCVGQCISSRKVVAVSGKNTISNTRVLGYPFSYLSETGGKDLAPHLDFTDRLVRGRTKCLVIQFVSLLVVLGSTASAQETTLARLSHESSAELPHTSISNTWSVSHSPHPTRSVGLPETVISRSAANALFVRSDLDGARTQAEQALRRNPKDAEALFIRMEVAAMEVDTATMLDAAIRLCEAGEASTGDPRVQLAAARIREAAANTPVFRAAVPRIKSLLTNSQQAWADLHGALLQAAMDGAAGLDPYTVSRAAGILTDWRIVGPLALRTLDLDDSISAGDDLSHAFYQNRAVENFQFPDGRISLPDYLAHQGTFYAAAHFGSMTTATWQVATEGGSGVEIYVDGKRVLQSAGQGVRSSTFEASPGPHRVLAKFTRAATPLRVTITLPVDEARAPLPKGISAQELAYLLAAGHYATGGFEEAARQIDAVSSANTSATLGFLLAQSAKPGSTQSLAAWDRVHALAPAALAADVALAKSAIKNHDSAIALRLANHVLSTQPTNVAGLEVAASAAESSADAIGTETEFWTRRIAAHPSCKTLQNAAAFYRAHRQVPAAESAEQKLDGCSPESLDYAKALSQQGNHSEAAGALQQLLAAAPLNRAARLMLIRELQLAGEDREARQAAAGWLHIAPNAERYHRLAAAGSEEEGEDQDSTPFYAAYRRDALAIADEAASSVTTAAAVELLDDHVAVSRPDGSVSLYVHHVKRLGSDDAAQPGVNLVTPQGAELLTLRVLHADGSATDLPHEAQSSLRSLLPGDVVDEEYVVNYAGDGGIPEHPEVFQFVFGSFNQRVLNSRFVVLSPAEQADRGVVIATGGAPAMTAKVVNGMLQRMWSSDDADQETSVVASAPGNGLPIVRVVEQENGWSVPSSAEHQRRIETIHPGPRPQDS
jgi:tetratricopeptide (TPR) repeat protein